MKKVYGRYCSRHPGRRSTKWHENGRKRLVFEHHHVGFALQAPTIEVRKLELR